MPIKTLGSLGKIKVGRVTGNTHILFWPNLHESLDGFEICLDLTTGFHGNI